MFEYMGDRISNAIKNIKGMGKITEDNISDAIREINPCPYNLDYLENPLEMGYKVYASVKAAGADVAAADVIDGASYIAAVKLDDVNEKTKNEIKYARLVSDTPFDHAAVTS